MNAEIARRLKLIFKNDFKKARYQQACIHNLWGGNNERDIRRMERKTIMFDVCKQLYLECLEILGERKF